MISIRKSTNSDIDFLDECIESGHERNDYPSQFNRCYTLSDSANSRKLYDYLGDENLFIVNSNNKDIGFFTNDHDKLNSHMGATLWSHPNACNMAILKMVRAACIRGVLFSVENDIKYIEFNTWHPLIVRAARKMIPELVEYKFYDTYRILFSSTIDIKNGSYIKIKNLDLIDLDRDNYTFKMES